MHENRNKKGQFIAGHKHTDESRMRMSENKLRRFRTTKYGCQIEDRLKDYKISAKERGYEWKLTDEEAREFFIDDCYYCGRKSDWDVRLKKRGEKIHPNGIDRADNNFGYIKENCVTACFLCNRLKSTFHISKYLQIVKTVYENLNLATVSFDSDER